MAAILLAAVAVAVWVAPQANWDLPLLGILLGFSVFSDLTAISTDSRVKISGSFLALTLAMVFLGGTPAALIGAITILVGWLRWRDDAARPAQQPRHLRDLPADRRHRLRAGDDRGRASPPTTRPSTCSSSPSSCSHWRSTSR